MKTISYIALTFFFLLGSYYLLPAQTRIILNADKAYELYNYEAALKLYQEAYRKKPTYDIAQRIAECYRMQDQYENAEKWYATTIKYKESKALDYYHYASMLRMNGKYKEAIDAFQNYKKKGVVKGYEDPTFVESCQAAIDMLANPTRHIIKNMEGYNTKGSDYGLITVAGRSLYVSDGLKPSDKSISTLYSGQLNRGVSGWTGRGYLNIYEQTQKGAVPLFSNKDNNRDEYHISSPSLSADGKELYYAVSRSVVPRATNRTKIGKVATLRVEIYSRTKKENGMWSDPIPFEYNNRDSYSTGDPFLTPDGQYLFFTSDMPGGKGGLDIYFCKREGSTWSKPQNAGNVINTKGNERFPGFDTNGNFYFSSNGHVGFGGLDIYKAKFTGGVFANLQNMGYPINSSYDDFGIFFIDSKHGYLASNREGGKGSDDIYSFVLQLGLNLVIKDKVTEEPVSNVTVTITDNVAQEDYSINTDSLGVVNFSDLKNDNNLNISISKPLYLTEEFTGQSFADLNGKTFLLAKNVIPVTVRDKQTGEPVPNSEVVVRDQSSGVIVRWQTDEMGTAYLTLERKNTYDIQGSQVKYLSTTILNQTYDDLNNLEIFLRKLEVGVTERVDNIYYDLADYKIRRDAEGDLDVLAEYMKKNPSMRIELASHTDSRGSDIFNLVLSVRRANAAVNYLVRKGISKSRMKAVGYGETRPVNHCTNGIKCTEAEYQANRRTEFTVLYIDK